MAASRRIMHHHEIIQTGFMNMKAGSMYSNGFHSKHNSSLEEYLWGVMEWEICFIGSIDRHRSLANKSAATV